MSIRIENLTKRYARQAVVSHINLEIATGELFVLIGPSGSGKSTLLRIIAGLNSADAGRVWLGGREVTALPPQEREVGFVFQNYALFKHMTVAENVEFALRVRGLEAGARKRRRDDLLELVGLAGLGGRKPAQLSGGQQQRVGLARALAHQPQVLLLDEPFGALDAKIRADLRRALRRIQRELKLTTVFVTHDQDEAFELGDRLGVMNFGRLLEVGPPADLYAHPQTEFVASFLGTANLWLGERDETGVHIGPWRFPLNAPAHQWHQTVGAQRVQVLCRPEDLALTAPGAPVPAGCVPLGAAVVETQIFSGALERLTLSLPLPAGVMPAPHQRAFGADRLRLEATRPHTEAALLPLPPGAVTHLSVRRIHALTHPGLSLLLLTDTTPASRVVAEVGGQLARLAHAQTTVLGYALHSEAQQTALQTLKEQLGSGLAGLEVRVAPDPLRPALAREAERSAHDLAVLTGPEALKAVSAGLSAGAHHVLWLSAGAVLPNHALISVTDSEPAKEDVLFAGRLLRHLNGQATLLTVAPAGQEAAVRRFLENAARTLTLLGVPNTYVVKTGPIRESITQVWQAGAFNLLVTGAPLSAESPIGAWVRELAAPAWLVVRSQFAAALAQQGLPRTETGRIRITEEVRP